jgi:formylglycine-generating enzyme required for sulfatase activity
MGFDGGEEGRYEGPVRRITINYAYAVGKYEVSNAEYRRFINDTGHVSARDCNLLRDGTYRAEPGTNWQDPGYQRPIRENEPVVCISWNDAKAFVAWLADGSRMGIRGSRQPRRSSLRVGRTSC